MSPLSFPGERKVWPDLPPPPLLFPHRPPAATCSFIFKPPLLAPPFPRLGKPEQTTGARQHNSHFSHPILPPFSSLLPGTFSKDAGAGKEEQKERRDSPTVEFVKAEILRFAEAGEFHT